MSLQKADTESDRWAAHYALMIQRANEQEIKEAIEKVKNRDISKDSRKKRKRGYWTPVGFYWFNQKKKWQNSKRHASKSRSACELR